MKLFHSPQLQGNHSRSPRSFPLSFRSADPVISWGAGESEMHPSMPNAAAINARLKELLERELLPFVEHGNRIAKSLYLDLPLPWTLSPPVDELDEATFFRKEVQATIFFPFFFLRLSFTAYLLTRSSMLCERTVVFKYLLKLMSQSTNFLTFSGVLTIPIKKTTSLAVQWQWTWTL